MINKNPPKKKSDLPNAFPEEIPVHPDQPEPKKIPEIPQEPDEDPDEDPEPDIEPDFPPEDPGVSP